MILACLLLAAENAPDDLARVLMGAGNLTASGVLIALLVWIMTRGLPARDAAFGAMMASAEQRAIAASTQQRAEFHASLKSQRDDFLAALTRAGEEQGQQLRQQARAINRLAIAVAVQEARHTGLNQDVQIPPLLRDAVEAASRAIADGDD